MVHPLLFSYKPRQAVGGHGKLLCQGLCSPHPCSRNQIKDSILAQKNQIQLNIYCGSAVKLPNSIIRCQPLLMKNECIDGLDMVQSAPARFLFYNIRKSCVGLDVTEHFRK